MCEKDEVMVEWEDRGGGEEASAMDLRLLVDGSRYHVRVSGVKARDNRLEILLIILHL